ncbi:hypothetical protein HMPREF0973_01162 [Prevotella veroralis F0319]|uniref:Uncharacterized protein n=1 Tax=Prevotella veroralis F0319 TaxID=649761 RepID=C9MNH5_9BACT|nr:hypothetical protein HMPREF0973_01162 [Prevotella veroralis F0319]
MKKRGALVLLDMISQSRDRRPRLSAKTQLSKSLPELLRGRGGCLTGCNGKINGRTDEGVCPYFVATIWID